MAARVAVGFYVCCMIETPQPLPNNHTKILIWTLIGVAIFVLCLTFVVFLGPFVMFAWIADRQADWFERQGPELNFIWMPASLPSRVLPFSVQS